MSPRLRHGSVALFGPMSIGLGSIVLAHVSGRDVVKRVHKQKTDQIYLVGDNREHSTDSRHYGAVPKSAILGVLMVTLPTAVSPPALTRPYGVWLGRIAAGIMIAMSMVHLFRIDTFIPLLEKTLGASSTTATAVALAVILAEIFAIPFALRMKLSPLAHLISGALLWVAPLLWLFISSWSLGYSENTGQLGEFFVVPAAASVIIINLAWLLFNHVTLYTLGYNSLRFSKLLRK